VNIFQVNLLEKHSGFLTSILYNKWHMTTLAENPLCENISNSISRGFII